MKPPFSKADGSSDDGACRWPVVSVVWLCACWTRLVPAGAHSGDWCPDVHQLDPYFELDQIFTEKVRSELIGRGRYKVLPDTTGVDAVLSGQITGLAIAPVSFTQDQQASRYVATVTANISLRDTADNKVLWQNPSLTLREEFDAASGTDALDPNGFLWPEHERPPASFH